VEFVRKMLEALDFTEKDEGEKRNRTEKRASNFVRSDVRQTVHDFVFINQKSTPI
jgi:hypothetical protein